MYAAVNSDDEAEREKQDEVKRGEEKRGKKVNERWRRGRKSEREFRVKTEKTEEKR